MNQTKMLFSLLKVLFNTISNWVAYISVLGSVYFYPPPPPQKKTHTKLKQLFLQLRISLYFRLQLIDKLERNLHICWKSLKQIPSKWQFYYPKIFIPCFQLDLSEMECDSVLNLQNVRWNLNSKSKWQLLLKPASWVLHFFYPSSSYVLCLS